VTPFGTESILASPHGDTFADYAGTSVCYLKLTFEVGNSRQCLPGVNYPTASGL
jgi:hypothetical protein